MLMDVIRPQHWRTGKVCQFPRDREGNGLIETTTIIHPMQQPPPQAQPAIHRHAVQWLEGNFIANSLYWGISQMDVIYIYFYFTGYSPEHAELPASEHSWSMEQQQQENEGVP